MGRGDGHMDQVPNPTRPTTNCLFTPMFLINMNHEFDLARKNIAKVLAFQPLEKPASFPKPWLNTSPPFPYAAPAAR